MPPDATRTKQRLLEAAQDEFASFGLAGARVDRIADTASVNKRLIYNHFGNKADLFDLIVAQSLQTMATAVPFRAEDLPRYAGDLFDYLLKHPEVLRLVSWAQLERPEPTTAEQDTYRPKLSAIAAAQQNDSVTSGPTPADLLALVLGLTTAWANASPALRSLVRGDPYSRRRLQEHRSSMVAAVQAITTSSTTTSGIAPHQVTG